MEHLKNIKPGAFIISIPFSQDNYLKRSVIVISQHDEEGSIGFILNKPTDLSIHEGIEDFPRFPEDTQPNIFFGGPVQTDTIHFLHKEAGLEGCKKLSDGIYWGGDIEQLKTAIKSKLIKAKDIKFIAGYCGWKGSLLESDLDIEIKKKLWLYSKGFPNLILTQEEEDCQKMWGIALRLKGSKFAVMANFNECPSLN